jgi:hypothetical protein
MQFTSAPSNTLYINVVLKKHPLSKQPISISITAAMYQNFTVSKALYFSELPLNSTLASVHATFARFQKQANAANFEVVKFNQNVFSYVTKSKFVLSYKK